jgi:RNA polymerase sigma-70 factor (ECF subfamily)
VAAVGSDEDLMVRVQAGDPQALAALIDRWRGPLYAFLWRRAGDGADDLFQESWIRVARARDRFDRTRRFSTWLFQIANNLCRDRWRRLDARRRALDSFHAETHASGADVAAAPALPADTRLARRLEALPERLREVLVLRYYHDQSEAEIAEILGIPRGTVKSRLHAAVRAARELLKENHALD